MAEALTSPRASPANAAASADPVVRRIGLADIGVAEFNEAFASQTLACIRQLDLDPARVNPGGGAIALGHPLGCSGARIVATLSHGMARTRTRHGLATMCIGVGQGIAVVLERLS